MIVRKSSMSESWEVCVDDTGTKIDVGNGIASFEPIPICRVPVGYGRTSEQAERLATFIAGLLGTGNPKSWLEGSNALEEFGIRTLENSSYKPTK